MAEINPFNDVPEAKMGYRKDIFGQDLLDNVAAIAIGRGNRAFKADESGIWLGGNTFAEAPFSVDMEGNITASSLDLSLYVAKAGTSQTLTGDIQVGNGNVKIDGANKRIIINDGTNDRILIGYQASGF